MIRDTLRVQRERGRADKAEKKTIQCSGSPLCLPWRVLVRYGLWVQCSLVSYQIAKSRCRPRLDLQHMRAGLWLWLRAGFKLAQKLAAVFSEAIGPRYLYASRVF